MDWLQAVGTNGPGYSNGAMASAISNNFEEPLVIDSENDAIAKWAQSHNYTVSKDTLDYLYNQYFTEKNNATAWERTLSADSTKYQRAVKDMQAAGLNPFLAVNNSFSSPSATSGSVGSGSIASVQNSKRQGINDVSKQLMASLGLIAGALLYALL